MMALRMGLVCVLYTESAAVIAQDKPTKPSPSQQSQGSPSESSRGAGLLDGAIVNIQPPELIPNSELLIGLELVYNPPRQATTDPSSSDVVVLISGVPVRSVKQRALSNISPAELVSPKLKLFADERGIVAFSMLLEVDVPYALPSAGSAVLTIARQRDLREVAQIILDIRRPSFLSRILSLSNLVKEPVLLGGLILALIGLAFAALAPFRNRRVLELERKVLAERRRFESIRPSRGLNENVAERLGGDGTSKLGIAPIVPSELLKALQRGEVAPVLAVGASAQAGAPTTLQIGSAHA